MRTPRWPRALALVLAAVLVSSIGCSAHPTSSNSTTGVTTGSGVSSAHVPTTGPVGQTSEASGSSSGSGSAPSTVAPSSRRTGSNVLVGSDDNFCAVIAAEWGSLSGRAVSMDVGGLADVGAAGSSTATMRATLAPFSKCTGVTVSVTSDPLLDQHLHADALNDKAPDVAVIGTPSLLADLAGTGTLKPAPRLVQADLDKLFDSGWRTIGTVNGQLYAAPLDVAANGLVWYSPEKFKEWGYRIPTSWSDFETLARTAARSGHGWCQTAPVGGQVRDWLTEVMLRQANTQAYDAWTTGTLPFDDPTVGAALTTVGSLLGLPDKALATTASSGPTTTTASPSPTSAPSPGAGSAATALVDGSCAMALADQDLPTTSTANASVGSDGELHAFAVPPIAARSGTPLVVSADLVVGFADRPEVQALQYYLSTAYWAGEQYAATGRISANRGLEIADVTDPVARLVVSLLQGKTAVSRLDATALMPAAVVTAEDVQFGRWAAGATSASAALAAVAARWPPR